MEKNLHNEQLELMAADEIAGLRAEIKALHEEIAELRHEADVDACHIAGLTAQIKALIAESDACPDKAAHPLVERVQYKSSRNGQPLTKTRAFPLYREAFDAEAAERGITHPEELRS
jgi:hypothetical protein